MKNIMLEAALAYAEMGYPVFPCWPGSKKPVSQHGFKDAITDLELIEKYWTKHPTANIAIPTEGLIVVDIDTIEGKPNPWLSDDPDKQLDLSNGAIQSTPRGGKHFVFRQPEGKHWRNTVSKLAYKVDTRGDGGYILVAPSISTEEDKSYEWAEDMGLDVERSQLAEPAPWLATLLDEIASGDGELKKTTDNNEGNAIPKGQRNDALASIAGSMRRIGMGEKEILAALLTTNQERCNPPMKDKEVEKIAWSVCRYEPDQMAVAVTENHYEQLFDVEDDNNEYKVEDPGPIPDRLLSVPGLINDIRDFTLETAPYPDLALAFTNALSFMGFLAGRKICDPYDNRSNLYLISLANSGVGKNHPRKVTQNLLYEAGISNCLSDSFASGEGIEDRMHVTPKVLFQTDEMDGLMNAITKGRDPRYEGIMNVLLKMYTSSSSVYSMRVKAGRESGSINQPSLSIFGTAIPSHFYASLSEKMMTNGFFARTIVTEAGKRSKWQNARKKDIPQSIVLRVKWWEDFRPGGGNLSDYNPKPKIVELTEDALAIMEAFCEYADSQYARAESRGDNGAMSIWARANEKARSLSLCYAASVDNENPVICEKAALWATEFIDHQTKRMIYMISRHLSSSEFETRCQNVLDFLKAHQEKNGDQWVTYRTISRKFRWKRREHDEIKEVLVDQGLIETASIKTKGKPRIVYRLVS